ncbi:NUDIX domain-containing protein [Dyella sp.]|uniref:NUDIX domain-containing protein n=1 Tax=Dyella sp. TaxID=1869338 RepID=UPI002ED471DD
MNDVAERVRIIETQVLSDHWYVLKNTIFDFRRSDGSWQRQQRETYDRGDGAVLLLYRIATRTVVLTRQFRFPAFVNGHHGMLIEAPAGLLEKAAPEQRIRAEVEEETGYRLGRIDKVFEAFMSPGSVTERLFFFVAEYDDGDRVSDGGGLESEGEDIEVFEVDFDEAMAMVARGDIADGKTIMLLQHAALHVFGPPATIRA